ncbi:MAG: hypothetical protein KF795_06845 [Labilithrix sp.]|nr:hypothetical protein [Labilithrix sp.]
MLALGLSACPPAARPPPVVEPGLEVPRLGGGGAEPSTSGVRFGRAAPVVGARWDVSVDARSATADPQGGVQLSQYLSSYTVEILATNGPAPSRVRLAFERNVQRYQGVDKATSIDGKTYVVDAAPPYVRDDAGGAAPEEETQRVLDIFPDLGTRTQIDQVLPDAAMAIGEPRDELAGAILAVIHPRAWTLNAGSAVLERTDTEDAVFSVALDATGTNGLRMVVKGEARVRLRDARLTQIAVEGTYDHASGGVSEPGTFTLRRTVRDR